MLRILLLLILLVHGLLASVLLNENIYEREKRVDLMLSFDTPFQGSVKKSVASDGTIDILLGDVEVQRPFFKSLGQSFLDSIAITRAGEGLALVKIVPKDRKISVIASKTVDGFGLRLRIVPQHDTTNPTDRTQPNGVENNPQSSTTSPNGLSLASDTFMMPDWRYWSVLGGLLFLFFVLKYLKKRAIDNGARGGWLMPKTLKKELEEGAVIRYQKPLDPHNRLILLEFGDKQYLMVVGNGNLLLDTFGENRIEDDASFDRMFEENRKRLDHLLQENHPDAYEAFKANASKEEHL
jgi:hypothetical protein